MKNSLPWIACFAIVYSTAVAIGIFHFDLSFTELVPIILIFGLVLPLITWVLLRRSTPLFLHKPSLNNEWTLIILLLSWIIFYIIYGEKLTNALLPGWMSENERWRFFIIIARKLIVFVLFPFLAYSLLGFSLADFGFKGRAKSIFSRGSLLSALVVSVIVLLFQYLFSGGAGPIRNGEITTRQLIIATPVTFVWMLIESGLVEEFFFRALLQSRLSLLLRSQAAGIVVAVLIFALVHVPGLYLRGSSSESIDEPMSLGFWVTYCILNMSMAGIFLGIAWSRTRNIYWIIVLHAVTDLLPNVKDFIHTWGI